MEVSFASTQDFVHYRIVGDIQDKIVRFTAILRLFRPSHFCIRAFWVRHDSRLPLFHDQFGYVFSAARDIIDHTQLSNAEIEEFKRFYAQYASALSRHTIIDRATRRYNESYDRVKPDDELLDLLIAVEILLMKSRTDTGEIRHKTSTRMAKLLEGEYERRKSVFNDMRESYDLRSTIVHSGNSGNSTKHVEKTRDYVARSIISMLNRLSGASHEEIIDRLDLDH